MGHRFCQDLQVSKLRPPGQARRARCQVRLACLKTAPTGAKPRWTSMSCKLRPLGRPSGPGKVFAATCQALGSACGHRLQVRCEPYGQEEGGLCVV